MKRNVEGGTKMGTYKGGSPTYRKLQENYDKIRELNKIAVFCSRT